MRKLVPVIERFFALVQIGPGCWLWQGSPRSNGYGSIYLLGRGQQPVHRVAWELAHGCVPEQSVLHRCDNPLCVRPTHLFLGTNVENMKDMVEKGRQAHGERHWKARITWKMVDDMRTLFDSGAYSQAELARMFNLRLSHVGKIVKRLLWIGKRRD